MYLNVSSLNISSEPPVANLSFCLVDCISGFSIAQYIPLLWPNIILATADWILFSHKIYTCGFACQNIHPCLKLSATECQLWVISDIKSPMSGISIASPKSWSRRPRSSSALDSCTRGVHIINLYSSIKDLSHRLLIISSNSKVWVLACS